jgi:hypothetical protein
MGNDLCENCAVVETLQKEQQRIGQYKSEIQSIRIKNRKLSAALDKANKRIYELRKERKHLRIKDETRLELLEELAQHRWIPVSERLPSEAKPKNRAKRLYFSEPTHNVWSATYDYENYRWPPMPKSVTHWKLIILPEPS